MGNTKQAEMKILAPRILDMYRDGAGIKHIARTLGLSSSTVFRHLQVNGLREPKNYARREPAKERVAEGGITKDDIASLSNSLKVGQRILCEVDVTDRESTQSVPVLKRMYIVRVMPNGILVSDNPDDRLGKLVTYVEIIQLRRRKKA